MNFKQLTLDVVTLAVMICCSCGASPVQNPSKTLMQTLARTRSNLQEGPSSLTKCFSHFFDEMNTLREEFGTNLTICEINFKESKNWIDNQFLPHLKFGNDTVNSVSSEMTDCQFLQPLDKALKCYMERGLTNSHNLKLMSYKLSEDFNVFDDLIHSAKSDEYICTNRTTRIYEDKYFKTTNNVYKCLESINDGSTEIATSTKQSN